MITVSFNIVVLEYHKLSEIYQNHQRQIPQFQCRQNYRNIFLYLVMFVCRYANITHLYTNEKVYFF